MERKERERGEEGKSEWRGGKIARKESKERKEREPGEQEKRERRGMK